MKLLPTFLIWGFLTACSIFFSAPTRAQAAVRFDFYGDPVQLNIPPSLVVDTPSIPTTASAARFYETLSSGHYQSLADSLVSYRDKYALDDWLFYQLLRKTAQFTYPKEKNYTAYTYFKWFLLSACGYNTSLRIGNGKVLFYVQSDEAIYNVPCYLKSGTQYVCLNFHDYKGLDPLKENYEEIEIAGTVEKRHFSYRIKQLPAFNQASYSEKSVRFNYYYDNYEFKLRLNPEIKTLFANYPIVDYESYFNIPLSQETYLSLIPSLKQKVKDMDQKKGVDFLMRFTRYAFLFEPDVNIFGSEKRLSPEQTLLYEYSDCEDRSALFFYLVKEIYDLPMLVLAYDDHVTIAVKFEKPVGKPIIYNGEKYSVCEPTPQKDDLSIGQILPELRKSSYRIAYAYQPSK